MQEYVQVKDEIVRKNIKKERKKKIEKDKIKNNLTPRAWHYRAENIMKNQYKEVNGTFYKKETNNKVIEVLEKARQNHTRIKLDYGDIKTGKSWGEVNDIVGYVGRSTGDIKIPLLIYNSRSIGGGGILDNCIIGIYTSKGNKKLY